MAKGITESDVHEAADAVLAAGERPTIERVRAQMGNTGSPNTITRYLESWFTGLSERMANLTAGAVAIPDPVHRIAAGVWQEALQFAGREHQARLQAERDSLAKAQRHAEEQMAAAVGMREQMRVRVVDLEATIEVAREGMAAAENRLAAAEVQIRDRDARTAQLEAQVASLGQEREAMLEEASRERQAHAAALQEEQSRHAAHERRWLNELDVERATVKQLRTELESARARAGQEARLAAEAAKAAEAALAACARDRDVLQAKLQGAERSEQQLQQRAVALQAELEASRDEGRGAQLTIAELRERCAGLVATIAQQQAAQDSLGAQLRVKDDQIALLTAGQGKRGASRST
ncbi:MULTISPECIES: DNA-binding protein [Achromobacter]|uniref:KfrA N-terminal DNA-binding domain-containing protein n=1 Tax=Achromobacter mucicolens TaxID=1389922 RepID=A0ABM8LK92_9BURK|nr:MULTISPECIES: DNA-binding protein [Achromobacter]AVG43935.1 hypothetical protein MC81_31000 [Achromobacter insolitus]CAB3845229.1 hypothetical protein LMG3410_01477 [Achromobacter aegrifaciens]CAB3914787.1 hypothetical protein LMG3415_05172 [Achromobacter mucicolens]